MLRPVSHALERHPRPRAGWAAACWLAAGLAILAGCSKASSQDKASGGGAARASEVRRCVDGDSPLAIRTFTELERRALDAEELGDFDRMLACAQEALRADEELGWAAHLRAEALVHMGRLQEAQEAFTVALALAPDDPYLLAGIADLYANRLPPSRERSVAALHFANRGLRRADDVELVRRLHLLAAWGEADLGRFDASLTHGRRALRIDEGDDAAWRVVGRALFELTRFDEAEQALRRALAIHEDAEGLHLLGLALEWLPGRREAAEEALAKATALEPYRFPAPVAIDDETLGRMVAEEVERLPARERELLRQGDVPVLVERMPSLADLRTEVPPLSPTALGMFRGPPLGVASHARREIHLYTANLRRSAASLAELRHQIRITLLHEIGHLAGEDEADLRARGLE